MQRTGAMLLSWDKKVSKNFLTVSIISSCFILQTARQFALASNQIEPSQINAFVRQVVRYAIKDQAKNNADAISSAIMRESFKHDFDPIILISIIETESGFSPKRRGTHGEIGLM